ncbi:hypothetical protein vB_PsyM_KIL3b_0147 [Pseudomonas phage vB_PsyM_KIL3b]|uniref:Uncharacterized protein n=3 Tax=Pseudomonas phage vB_PsyM_KIL1 TaxID=1777065 RepID=A0A142IG57_9CAUD|nr:hypothetical protein BH774_gp056 [Pseudomonas phage vB_PsyM_KIL1]AMR57393.1 hypothetical protein vB_PsyM_KIL1_0146 [Pseudomonas phage vB_PsyM_KIL1]AMR57714.1 hypothetical protein vB_PsyM_KIL3_0147 [Pseudomonas phage vB_PsyM_KIL3]AMR58212.1 hypothetical protein vB_PsyM_KIL3b_0147 [Pseudomonas phage vB_PsyM_KIL3b]
MKTPAQEAGIEVGSKVIMRTGDWDGVHGFKRGCAVTLIRDDNTDQPLFQNHSMCQSLWIPLRDVELLIGESWEVPQSPSQKMGLIVGVTKVRLTGIDTSYRAGKVYVLEEDDNSDFPFFRELGNKHSRECFSLSRLEIVSEVPPEIGTTVFQAPPNVFLNGRSVGGMSVIQQQALSCFTTMLRRAQLVAAGNEPGDELFYTGYGICDNIGRCKPNDADTEQLSMIKDNLIRRVPSYSGNYNYPVSCPENPNNADAADNAWSKHRNKWTGAYGANRIKQLEELIHIIEHEWKEEYAKEMTPSQRIGLIVGVSVVKRTSSEKLYRFVRDDRSSDPYFESLTDGGQVSIDLRSITLLAMEPVEGDTRSVADFLAAIEAEQKAKTDMERQIADLQQAVAKIGSNIAVLDYSLRVNHRVQRLS